MFPDNRIRELRKAARLSQSELGQMVGLHQTQIGNIENGTRALTVEWCRRLAKALNVAAADLLADADNPDRLAPVERELVANYRAAEDAQRMMIERVAEPVSAYRAEPRRAA